MEWKNREKELRKRKECCYYEDALKGSDLYQKETLRKLIAESKKVYFVFTSSARTDFARAIMTYTNSNYYHVAVSLNEGLMNLYSFSPQIGQDKLSGGFTCEKIHSYKKNDYDIHVSCMVITSEKNKQLLQEISAMMKYQRQTEYNYTGLINYVLGNERKQTDTECSVPSLSCIYFVSWVLMHFTKKLVLRRRRISQGWGKILACIIYMTAEQRSMIKKKS